MVSSGYETLIDIAHGRVYDRSSPGAGGNYEVHWSRDGHTLILLNNDERSAGKVDFWSVYSLENSQTTTFHDILAWKANPVNADRVVIAWLEHDGKTAMDVMNMDSSNRIRLLDLGASLPRPTGDGTQIEWSPDGAWIVVPWTDPISLLTGFTLVRADGSQGSGHYDFPAGSQWRWLLNGQALGYLISQANGQSVGILNMATGARHVLIDGPQDIRFIATPGINDLLAVWWEANDLSAHIKAYQPDGTLAYQADGASLIAAPDGNNPSPYLAVSGQLMRSPDGKLAHVYGYSNFGSRISIAEQPMTAVVTAQNVAIRLPIEWSDNVQWSHCG